MCFIKDLTEEQYLKIKSKLLPGKKNDRKNFELAFNQVKQKAAEDIVVLKRVKRTYWLHQGPLVTPFKNFEIEPGYMYYQTGEKKFTGHYLESTDFYPGVVKTERKICIYHGLHSFSKDILKRRYKIYYKETDLYNLILEAYIPKGATYVFDGNDEYVSDKLVITNKVIKKGYYVSLPKINKYLKTPLEL